MTDFPQLISQLETGTADPKMAFDGLNEAQKSRLQQAGCEIYTGKVRDMVRRGDALFMVHSDRLTALIG